MPRERAIRRGRPGRGPGRSRCSLEAGRRRKERGDARGRARRGRVPVLGLHPHQGPAAAGRGPRGGQAGAGPEDTRAPLGRGARVPRLPEQRPGGRRKGRGLSGHGHRGDQGARRHHRPRLGARRRPRAGGGRHRDRHRHPGRHPARSRAWRRSTTGPTARRAHSRRSPRARWCSAAGRSGSSSPRCCPASGRR